LKIKEKLKKNNGNNELFIILWSLLIGKIEPPLVRSLINYYYVSKAMTMVGNCQSSVFTTTIGVKQGGPLSPRLFSLYTENLGKYLDNTEAGIIIGNIKINNLFYADDILLITNTKEEMNKLLLKTEEFIRLIKYYQKHIWSI
jgi:hypothetical protein